jgi:tetratricopeptide (TPR) repeat protein
MGKPEVGEVQKAPAGLPGLGGRAPPPPQVYPRPEPSAKDLECVLKKEPAAGPTFANPGTPAASPAKPGASRAKPGKVSPAKAREARRLAMDGARFMQQGRLAEAITALQEAVKLNPAEAALHYHFGVALLTTGRLEQAAERFAAALRLDPKLAEAHHNLDSFGQERKAIESYEAAIALKPNIAAVQTRLGELYLSRGKRAEAQAAFRAAAAAAPGTAIARMSEARALEAFGAFEEVLAAARGAVKAHPEDGQTHGFLAKLLGEAGLLEEAAAHYLRAAELSSSVSAWIGFALNRKFAADDGPLIARMNDAFRRSNLTPRDRTALHFAIGKALDDMGNYKAAMREFEAANRLRALGGRIDRDALVRRVDRLIAATPRGFHDRQPDPGVDDATPIVIAGLPRSGTTLVEQILSSHPEVAAGGELDYWNALDASSREDPLSIAPAAEATRRLADDYLAVLRASGPDAKRVTDKAVTNFFDLGLIHRVFPNATLIHTRRHPIDVALSIFTTNFGVPYSFASDRGDLVCYVTQYQRLMAHWREALPPDRFVEAEYEALVADPEPHTRRLVAACGLEWNDACLAPHRNTRRIKTASLWQARQPIYRTSVERWRRYEPWLGELLELMSGA